VLGPHENRRRRPDIEQLADMVTGLAEMVGRDAKRLRLVETAIVCLAREAASREEEREAPRQPPRGAAPRDTAPPSPLQAARRREAREAARGKARRAGRQGEAQIGFSRRAETAQYPASFVSLILRPFRLFFLGIIPRRFSQNKGGRDHG